jgi:ATP-binding cassette subfamily F protein 3
VRVFPGNYKDYLWRKAGKHEETPTLSDVLIGVPPAVPIPMPSPAGSAKRVNPMKLKQLETQAKTLEDQIASLESQIQQSETALSTYVSADEALRLSNLLIEQRTQLEKAMSEWEQVTGQIEATA